MGILDELFRRKPEDEFLPQYAKPEEMTMEQVIQAAAALAPSVPKSEKPADPLRWAADAVGQNKDLPAPQFFMDPRALSARNMLHSALNTSANWLDGTKDPSLVGPQEMVSPFGLGVVGSMGTGVKNAMTKPSRDHSISEALGRQYPNEVAGGEMREVGRKIVVDDGKRQSWAEDPHLERAWNAAGGQLRQRNQGRKHFIEPANVNTPGPYSVMADNAKGSAPGTIINSMAGDVEMSGPHWRAVSRDQSGNELGFVKGTVRDGVLVIDKSTLNPNEVGKGHGLSMYRALVDKAHEQGLRVDSASTVSGSAARVYDALERRGYRVERGPSEILDDGPRGQKVQTTDFNRRPFSIMPLADNAKGSAPGTVVNSIAEGASKDGLTAAERAAVDKRWADYYAHIEKQKQPTKKDAAKAEREQATKAEKEFEGLLNDPRHRAAGRPEDIRTDPGRPHTFRPGGGGRGGGFRADPMASAPGLAANSTQQPKDASQLSEPMLMELLRKLEEGA